MNLRARKLLTAWLGLIAMWLVVLAPVVSQLVASARADEPVSVLCSATQPVGVDVHRSHEDPLAACSYCDLLADHFAVPALPPSLSPVILLVIVAALPVLSTRFTPFGAFPSGRPRAPPAFPQVSL